MDPTLDRRLCLSLSFFVFLSVCRSRLEVTVTSLHPPRLCRIAVFSIKPTFSLSGYINIIIIITSSSSCYGNSTLVVSRRCLSHCLWCNRQFQANQRSPTNLNEAHSATLRCTGLRRTLSSPQPIGVGSKLSRSNPRSRHCSSQNREDAQDSLTNSLRTRNTSTRNYTAWFHSRLRCTRCTRQNEYRYHSTCVGYRKTRLTPSTASSHPSSNAFSSAPLAASERLAPASFVSSAPSGAPAPPLPDALAPAVAVWSAALRRART